VILLTTKSRKTIPKKTERPAQASEDELADLRLISEASLRGMWLIKREDVWDKDTMQRIKLGERQLRRKQYVVARGSKEICRALST